jgi:hypothetical protein
MRFAAVSGCGKDRRQEFRRTRTTGPRSVIPGENIGVPRTVDYLLRRAQDHEAETRAQSI